MIRCIKLRQYQNTLRGFVDLELSRVGLVLHDCTWHRHPDGKDGSVFRPVHMQVTTALHAGNR